MELLRDMSIESKALNGRCMEEPALIYCDRRWFYLKPDKISPNLRKNQYRRIFYVEKDFYSFKDVYIFAKSENGMYLNSHFAEKFARRWVDYYKEKSFYSFKQAYLYAKSPSGLNYNSHFAEKYAMEHLTW